MKDLPHIAWDRGVPRYIVDGKPTILLSGELRNSSSSSAAYMKPIWPKLKDLRMNAVIVSASWELVEPEPGVYVFDSVDHLIYSAREHGLRLVMIWFATWKNGISTYAPAWVKSDPEKYFRCRLRNGNISRTVSPVCDACIEADAAAFAALMRHIREIDAEEQTIIGMQVENESGFYGGEMDWSAQAVAAYEGPVPAELMEDLGKMQLPEPMASAFTGCGDSWASAFGAMGYECFMAYAFARSINRVAEAGKREYALPMFVNAWMAQYPGELPAYRPCGGPDSSVLPIWRSVGRALDAVMPDLYELNYREEIDRYSFGGKNPLLIAEMRSDRWGPAMQLYAVSRGALMVAPFGIDAMDRRGQIIPDTVQSVHQTMSPHDPSEFMAALYGELGGMQDRILQAAVRGDLYGTMQGALVQEGLNIGDYHIRVTFPYQQGESHYPGALMVIREGDGDFLMVGFSVHVDIASRSRAYTEFLSIDEGSFAGGDWEPGRRLNGDELGIFMGERPTVLRVRVVSY